MTERKVIEGACRNEPDAVRSHLYVEDEDGELLPMCGYGWNRDHGHAFGILRGWSSARGTCRLCERNLAAGKEPVRDGWPHPTRWL